MSTQHIVAAYNATDEAADGLALAALLAHRLGHDLVVARVVPGARPEITDRHEQQVIRATVEETRQAIVAALPEEGDVEITPVVDRVAARGLHDLARAEDAEAIVAGSSHRHGLGRLLLGSGPETIADDSPCPVFVAPPGFRDHAVLSPAVIGIADDGSLNAQVARRYAVDLAAALGLPTRDIRIASTRVATVVDGLVAATDGDVGLLVLGSCHRGRLGRAMLGSVAMGVLRAARGPVVVTPAR